MTTQIRPEQAKNTSCRIYNSAAQTIGNASWTTLTFDNESFDTDSMHSTVTNTGRITVPEDGVYLLIHTVGFTSNSTGFRATRFIKNGTTNFFGNSIDGTNGNTCTAVGTTILSLSASDYVTVQVYQNSGGDLDVLARDDDTNFMVVRLF